jgi:hypothetical protein
MIGSSQHSTHTPIQLVPIRERTVTAHELARKLLAGPDAVVHVEDPKNKQGGTIRVDRVVQYNAPMTLEVRILVVGQGR